MLAPHMYQDDLNDGCPHVRESMKASMNIRNTVIGWRKSRVRSGLCHHFSLQGTPLSLLSTMRTFGATVTVTLGGKGGRAILHTFNSAPIYPHHLCWAGPSSNCPGLI